MEQTRERNKRVQDGAAPKPAPTYLDVAGKVANEVARHGVRVNCVAPGAVLTDRLVRMPVQVRRQVAASHPLGRLGVPEDVALATLFLVSDASSWRTGVTSTSQEAASCSDRRS